MHDAEIPYPVVVVHVDRDQQALQEPLERKAHKEQPVRRATLDPQV